MPLPLRHVVRQGKVVSSLGSTALHALLQHLDIARRPTAALPGPEITARVATPGPALVRDYVRHVGGDPDAYQGAVPAHLFPQWTLPLAARSLRDIPYPLLKVINAGCRLEVNERLPAGEPLDVGVQLLDVDDDGRRAVLHQRIVQRLVSGRPGAPPALVAHLFTIVPATADGRPRPVPAPAAPRKEAPRIPDGAREIAYWPLGREAGLAFAMLTGDFNPAHWVPPYARALGFESPILHGFATMARAMEGLHRARFAGAVDRIGALDVRFTRPLALPASVGLYLEDQTFYVGDARGGPAYLVGTFEESRP